MMTTIVNKRRTRVTGKTHICVCAYDWTRCESVLEKSSFADHCHPLVSTGLQYLFGSGGWSGGNDQSAAVFCSC